MVKKLLILSLSLVVLLGISLFSVSNMAEAAGSKTFTVGQGGKWKVRIDFPSSANPKYHVHVYDPKGEEVGVENLDGTPSHGQTLSKVPNKVKKKLKNIPNIKNMKRSRKN